VYCRRVVEEREAKQQPEALAAMSKLVAVLKAKGKLREAERFGRRVFDARTSVLGEEHRETLASAGALAEVLQAQGCFAEAEQLYCRMLSGQEMHLTTDHEWLLDTVDRLSSVFEARNNLPAAKALSQRIFSEFSNKLGVRHRSTLASMSKHATHLEKLGELSEAEAMHSRAFEALQQELGISHVETLSSAETLGRLLRSQGKLDRAETLARNVLEKCELLCGASHASTVRCMLALAFNLQDLGRTEEAEALQRHALRLQEAQLGAHNSETHEAMLGLANMLVCRNEFDEAEVLLRNVHFWRELELGLESPHTRNCMNQLAQVVHLRGNLDEAEALFRRALVSPGPSRANTETFEIETQSMTGLIEVLEAKGNTAEAEVFRGKFCQTHEPDVSQRRAEALQEPRQTHSPCSPRLPDPLSFATQTISRHQIELPNELTLAAKETLEMFVSLDVQSSNGTTSCAKHFGHNGEACHKPVSHTPEMPEADDPRLMLAPIVSPRRSMMTSRERITSLSTSPRRGPTPNTAMSPGTEVAKIPTAKATTVEGECNDSRCWRWLVTYCICGATSQINAVASSSRNSPGPDGAAGPLLQSKWHNSKSWLAGT